MKETKLESTSLIEVDLVDDRHNSELIVAAKAKKTDLDC